MNSATKAPVIAPDHSLYEYCVVRYVPRIDREEFINVGLLMMCKRRRWLKARIHLDEKKLAAMGSALGMAALRRQLELFERRDVPQPGLPVEETYRWLCAPKNAVVQTSPSHPGLADGGDLDLTFERLFSELVL